MSRGLLLTGVGLASAWISQAGAQGALAPLINNAGGSTIADHYIVVFKRGAALSAMASAQTMARGAGGKIGFTYSKALRGFSITASPAAIDRLRAMPDVAYVEVDSVVKASIIQNSPPLGLDRTSERQIPLDDRFTYSHDGTGVHAYVLDTGIRTTHTEFGGRASGAFDAIMDGGGTDDCNGHGTHVAGTIGGATFGIAKDVTLHAVRVLDCDGNGTVSQVIAGVDWVTANATLPAVANMSLGAPVVITSINDAVTDSIAAGITYTLAAGNDAIDACGASPASTPDAITVGNVDPTNDTTAFDSNFGSCVDLFGPGENIESAWFTSDTATNTIGGTSMAAPHVAGAAALYLEAHPASSPAAVRAAIMTAANIFGVTAGWAGIVSLPAGSPNILLHWGSLNDGVDDGDPHLRTVEGIKYDFQPAGEFTLLRDANGLEIQTRQTPVQTSWHIGPDAYTGLGGCVSINTAVAARVNGRRVTFQNPPVLDQRRGNMELRVDGGLVLLGSNGLALGPGGRVIGSLSGGIEVNFPDGTTLIATPKFWTTMNLWYLDVSVTHTTGTEGLIGMRPPGSWLPALPDGSSLGPKPAALHQRYVDLNVRFADAWRVTSATSLFDYAPGTSTSSFTVPGWPPESPPCMVPGGGGGPVVHPVELPVARERCGQIRDKDRLANCIADVQVTGEAGFAQLYQISEQLAFGSTATQLDDASSNTALGAAAKFTATVVKNAAPPAIPTGTAQLVVDGVNTGAPVALDAKGQAVWNLATLTAGTHQIRVRYAPTAGSVYLASQSLPVSHVVH